MSTGVTLPPPPLLACPFPGKPKMGPRRGPCKDGGGTGCAQGQPRGCSGRAGMGSGGPSLLRAPPPARGLGAMCPPPGPPSAHRQQLTLLSPLHADLAPPGLAESPRETAQTLVKSLSSSGCVQYPGCCWARMCLQELKGTGISWGKRGKRPRKESLGGGGWQRTGKVCLSTEDGSDVPGGSRSVGLRSGPRGGLQIEQAYLEHS